MVCIYKNELESNEDFPKILKDNLNIDLSTALKYSSILENECRLVIKKGTKNECIGIFEIFLVFKI